MGVFPCHGSSAGREYVHEAALLLLTVFCMSLVSANKASARQSDPGALQAVSDTLDALHTAAAEADFDRYFGLYADDAIFYGTDATERWTKAEFEAYAAPVFDAGRGWTYDATQRNVFLSENGRFAWFDERLENASLGETRGSGVLRLSERGWQVVQYNLTIPVPNELAGDVVRQIRDLDSNR